MRLFVTILLLTSLRISAQTTYFFSATGLKTNTGLNANSPWPSDTLRPIPDGYGGETALTTLPEFSNILFKRGETHGRIRIGSYYRTIKPVDSTKFGAYGDVALPKPIITTMRQITGSNVAANWTQTLTNVWRFKQFTQYQPRIWVTESGVRTELSRAKDSTLVTAIRRTAWANITGGPYIYIYSTSNPATFYSLIESGSLNNNAVYLDGFDNVAVRDLDIQGGDGASLDVSSIRGIIVENCNIGAYSTRQGLRMGNMNYDKIPASQLIIRTNILDTRISILKDLYYFDGVGTSGDAISVNQNCFNVEIYNNYCKDWGHTGIEIVDNAYQGSWVDTDNNPATPSIFIGGTDSVTNIHVYNNYVKSPNISYGRGFNAVYKFGRNIVIERNWFDTATVQCQFIGANMIFRYNIVSNITNSEPKKLIDQGVGVALAFGSNYDIYPEGNKFYNNVFANCEQGGFIFGSRYNEQTDKTIRKVQNNQYVNNIFFNCGYNIFNPSYDANFMQTHTGLWFNNNTYIGGNTFRNNLFYNPNAGGLAPIWYGISSTGGTATAGTERLTATQFNAKNLNTRTGSRADSITSSNSGNPSFLNGFEVGTGSAAIGAGFPTGQGVGVMPGSVWPNGVIIGNQATLYSIGAYVSEAIQNFFNGLQIKGHKIKTQ